MYLYDTRISLQNAYPNHVNLGPYYMKDVVVGFVQHDKVCSPLVAPIGIVLAVVVWKIRK